MAINVLVVTKGHPFDYNSFYAIFDESDELNATVVEQPAAQVMLRPENVSAYDAVVFYDMWGTETDGGANFVSPPDDYVKTINALVESGMGMVLLNHATVQWPAWPYWREITGTSFMLTEGELYGETAPGSGYRGGGGEPERNATHRLIPVDPTHPVCAGLEAGFEITDELYIKTAGFEDDRDILPLFRSDYDFVKENFNPPPLAPAEEQANWDHPRGSNLITWAKRTGNSPVVATESGDGPLAYANPAFRLFLTNAIKW
ncbi:MAG: ThuA domain-containing protein, partial [Proteobacteria bacterium]|nr:ThuA domain-containing protein [Pseudomonadota bacterium]